MSRSAFCGVSAATVGRIASCASWAFFDFVLYSLTPSESACLPNCAWMVSRISRTASAERLTESVRM
ncbi:hypothetical protein D3C83_152290 [compost metagenome]